MSNLAPYGAAAYHYYFSEYKPLVLGDKLTREDLLRFNRTFSA
jgi:hypothetical protein